MSTDGQVLLASTGGAVDFWRFATGEHLKRIETGADFINTLVLTPDNKTLVAGAQDGFIRIVNAETGDVVHKIDGGLWIGRSIAVSPDYEVVALGAVHPTIRQWNLSNGKERFPELTVQGHVAEVHCVAYSPDGRLIASGGANRQIKLWDAQTGALRLNFPSESSANRLAFTPSGKNLLTSWENSGVIRIWDVETGNQVQSIDTGTKRVRVFAVTSDGAKLVSVVSDDGFVQVWDLAAATKLRQNKFTAASTRSIGLSSNGRVVVMGAANGMITVMDIESGDELATLAGHQQGVDSLAFSSDGTLLASGSTDQTIRIWDTATWKLQRILKGHDDAVTSVAFLPKSHILASGGGKASYPLYSDEPQRIRIWNADTGMQIGAFWGHGTNTSAISFAPDGQRLVSAHDDTTLLVWDVSRIVAR